MKIKVKQTIQTEVEVEIIAPAFFKKSDVYYAVYNEEDKWSNGLRVDNMSIMFQHPSTIANYVGEATQITEQDFNAFVEETMDRIQGVFYQTVNQ